jgi:hypothetical protein
LGGDDLWSWQAFEKRWREFQGTRWPRSISKRLLETLARGDAETAVLVNELKSRGRELPEPSCAAAAWFDDNVVKVKNTLYFDPLDFLDFHVDLPAAENPVQEERADVAVAD